MDFDLDKHTIFKTLSGSRVYGTSDEASVLVPIKRGEWSYEKLMAYEEMLSKNLEEYYKDTDLQNSPRRNKVEKLGIQIVAGYLLGTP